MKLTPPPAATRQAAATVHEAGAGYFAQLRWQVAARPYAASGVFGITFMELEWKHQSVPGGLMPNRPQMHRANARAAPPAALGAALRDGGGGRRGPAAGEIAGLCVYDSPASRPRGLWQLSTAARWRRRPERVGGPPQT